MINEKVSPKQISNYLKKVMKKISNSGANLLEMIDKIISEVEVNNKKLYSITTDDFLYPHVYSDAVN